MCDQTFKKPICSECKGSNVRADAYTEWDPEQLKPGAVIHVSDIDADRWRWMRENLHHLTAAPEGDRWLPDSLDRYVDLKIAEQGGKTISIEVAQDGVKGRMPEAQAAPLVLQILVEVVKGNVTSIKCSDLPQSILIDAEVIDWDDLLVAGPDKNPDAVDNVKEAAEALRALPIELLD